jgi:protein required for attachment to host cells
VSDCWVIVADGARARFMTVERLAEVPERAAVRLAESARLSNPLHTVGGRRALRKIKSGRDTGRGRIAPHGYTDKREPHELEILRRFAARIAGRARALIAAGEAASMVLVADPRMLGLLRTALKPVCKERVKLREFAHDFTWCTTAQLQRRLARSGLLPANKS